MTMMVRKCQDSRIKDGFGGSEFTIYNLKVSSIIIIHAYSQCITYTEVLDLNNPNQEQGITYLIMSKNLWEMCKS